MSRYLFAKELKSESKVAWFIYAVDFLFIIIFMVCANIFSFKVSSVLEIPYYIFSFIVAILLTMKSPYNHNRRMYQSLMIFLRKDIAIYHPIKKKNDTEEEEDGV